MSFHDEHFQPEEVDEQIEELLHTVFPQSKATEDSTRLVRELQALSMDDKARLQKIRARLAEHANNVGAIITPIEIQDYQDTHQVGTNFYPERLPKLRKGKRKLLSTLAGLVAVLLIASTVVFFAQSRARINATQTGASQHQPTQSAMSSLHISGSGFIYPKDQTVISFPVDGRAINVLVKLGDQVTLKQPLIQLDPAQVHQLQANVAAAQQNYDIVLAKKGTAAEIAAAQQQLAEAKNQLQMLQAQLGSAFMQNGKLLASQAGVVTEVNVRPGETFKANTVLVAIADESALVVHAKISSVYFGRVSEGQTATVITGDLSGGENFSGTVVSIVPLLQQSGTFEVWVMITHPKGTPPWHLTSGEIALVYIPIHK